MPRYKALMSLALTGQRVALFNTQGVLSCTRIILGINCFIHATRPGTSWCRANVLEKSTEIKTAHFRQPKNRRSLFPDPTAHSHFHSSLMVRSP
ncbi:hypothetical protein F6X41_10910 [Dickeya dianthicola]|nr:hypothetical protein [Dickeya dianthicola]